MLLCDQGSQKVIVRCQPYKHEIFEMKTARWAVLDSPSLKLTSAKGATDENTDFAPIQYAG